MTVYDCIAHFVSDLVLNPEYRFSHAMAVLKEYTLIHNPWLLILCNVFARNMYISSHSTIAKHAYGACRNSDAHFSSLLLCAINVAI